MKTKTVNGVVISRRPVSSGCPSGAWFSTHYHTSRAYGYWPIWETGKGEVSARSTAEAALERMAELEKQKATP